MNEGRSVGSSTVPSVSNHSPPAWPCWSPPHGGLSGRDTRGTGRSQPALCGATHRPRPTARPGEWPEVKPPPLPPSRVTGHAAHPSKLHFSGFRSWGGAGMETYMPCRVAARRPAEGGPERAWGREGPSAPRSIDDLPLNLVFVDTRGIAPSNHPCRAQVGLSRFFRALYHRSVAMCTAGAEKSGEEGSDTGHGWSGRSCARDALKSPRSTPRPSHLCPTQPSLSAG